ncbi:hypothetical protein [Bauldia litoralis]|uniref:hypothetical protein n=1 Tax=Bauldia litoralis TaxID=665467 RepID=UPI0032644515
MTDQPTDEIAEIEEAPSPDDAEHDDAPDVAEREVEIDPFAGVEFLNEDAITDDIVDRPAPVSVGAKHDSKTWKRIDETIRGVFAALADASPGPKEGVAWTQGTLIGPERNSKAIDQLFWMAIDGDGGRPIADIIGSVVSLGCLCLIHTSYSHRATETEIDADQLTGFETKNNLAHRSTESIRRFLSEVRHYDPSIVESATFDRENQNPKGLKVFARHAPMDKTRIVFPLAEPYAPAKQGMKHTAGIVKWGDKLRGLASLIGMSTTMDRKCLDPARLFYLPRYPKAKADQHRTIIIGGKLLNLETVPEIGRSTTANADPFTNAGEAMGGGGNSDLISWVARRGDGFQIVDLLREHGSDRIRHDYDNGKVEVECPFDSEHSNSGDPDDRGCFVENAATDANPAGFRWGCGHNACADRTDRLIYVAEALRLGWFPRDALDDEAFDVIDRSDDEAADFSDVLADANALAKDAPLDAVKAVIRHAYVAGADGLDIGELKSILASKMKGRATKADLTETFDAIGKSVRAEKRKTAAVSADGAKPMLNIVDDGFEFCLTETWSEVTKRSEGGGLLFTNGSRLIRTATDQRTGRKSAEPIVTTGVMRAVLNDVISWWRTKEKSEDLVNIDTPASIGNAFLNGVMPAGALPYLYGVMRAPFYVRDGGEIVLIDQPGYHSAGYIYDPPEGLTIPAVSDKPTAGEVEAAKRFLFDDALVDFPFDDGADGDGTSSRAHALAALIQMFVRPVIAGPTPIYLFSKPMAGTGAGLLLDTLMMTASGERAALQTFPDNEEEVRKMLASATDAGMPYVIFDNVAVGTTVDSASLASATTTGKIVSRRLGGNTMIEAEVRQLFALTGNNVALSHELARRCVLVHLDAHTDPTKRSRFKHDQLAWLPTVRGEVVAAVLTLVNHWIATPVPATGRLAGFEEWSDVVGGILESAGIEGFLVNKTLIASRANEESEAKSLFVGLWLAQDGFGSPRQVGDPDDDISGDPGSKSLVTLITENQIDIRNADGRSLWGRDGAAKAQALSYVLRSMQDNEFETPEGPAVVRIKRTTRGNRYYLEPGRQRRRAAPPTLNMIALVLLAAADLEDTAFTDGREEWDSR